MSALYAQLQGALGACAWVVETADYNLISPILYLVYALF